jgi:hypothetical protein
MSGATIIGFPIQPLPVRGLPGAELAAPFRTELDGTTGAVWRFRCPVCGVWGDIDDEQLHGEVSIDHTEFVRYKRDDLPEGTRCTFHETYDLYGMTFDGPTNDARSG